MTDVKDDSKPQKTEVTATHTEINELKEALKKEYRTDHLTLPVVAPLQDKERDKASALEREVILNPDLKDDTIVDNEGTTLKEWKERLERGVMPKDAPKEALKGVGKHKVSVEETKGELSVVVVSPVTKDEVVIAHPDTKEGETPFGMEIMHKTTPVPEVIDSSKQEDKSKK